MHDNASQDVWCIGIDQPLVVVLVGNILHATFLIEKACVGQ